MRKITLRGKYLAKMGKFLKNRQVKGLSFTNGGKNHI